ncbi:hypothetical protein GUJ93_ZPchr0010g10386 [Zizania palustris]|uniref:Secreted protein n=1 Tax=Zizania palustris TaxID=103762 RepID=A0A8J6BGR6_ZIZPA|nr:hypothetical protein GUJ93_ZPchr0010g10386 [Zizania palustris]
MRKQRVSSSPGVVSLCKLLLTVIALICTLHPASVQGGRVLADAYGTLYPNRPTAPGVPSGRPYTHPGCIGGVYGCRGGSNPPAPATP